MSYQIPKFRHPQLPVNDLGYTKADYEGSISTLCAGCGHDSISGSIVKAVHELSIAQSIIDIVLQHLPEEANGEVHSVRVRVGRLSGIGRTDA